MKPRSNGTLVVHFDNELFFLTSSVTAVDRKGLTYGKRSEVGTKKQNHPRNLFRLREAAYRRIGHEIAAHGWIVEPRLCHCCFHQARGKYVYPDSFTGILECSCLRQTDDSMLGRRVSADARFGYQSGD